LGAWIICIVIAAVSIFALSVKAAFNHRHTPLLSQKELKEAIKRQKEEDERKISG
jgi:hypothetical protein